MKDCAKSCRAGYRRCAGALTGHLYRRYLSDVLDRLDEERLPEDWLDLSSGVLSSILSENQ